MAITVELFRNETERLRYAGGDRIFAAGDDGDAMYVVIAGEVELRVRGQLVETVGPGGVFGEMALIEQARRTAEAIAKSDCELVAIPEKRFTFMIQQTPHFALHIMKVMAERLRNMNARL
jgi:CRP/FNR family transcriptional regulator, cyclic AMP receptor protein